MKGGPARAKALSAKERKLLPRRLLRRVGTAKRDRELSCLAHPANNEIAHHWNGERVFAAPITKHEFKVR